MYSSCCLGASLNPSPPALLLFFLSSPSSFCSSSIFLSSSFCSSTSSFFVLRFALPSPFYLLPSPFYLLLLPPLSPSSNSCLPYFPGLFPFPCFLSYCRTWRFLLPCPRSVYRHLRVTITWSRFLRSFALGRTLPDSEPELVGVEVVHVLPEVTVEYRRHKRLQHDSRSTCSTSPPTTRAAAPLALLVAPAMMESSSVASARAPLYTKSLAGSVSLSRSLYSLSPLSLSLSLHPRLTLRVCLYLFLYLPAIVCWCSCK